MKMPERSNRERNKDTAIDDNSSIDFDQLKTDINEDLSDVQIPMEELGNTDEDPSARNNRLVAGMGPIESKDESLPVIGYAAEPLLPLGEACAPLSDMFHDLQYYVKMALDETPEEPPDNLTVDESAAIRLYTIEWEKPHYSLYSTLNHILKNSPREELQPFFKYLKLFVSALAKLPCFPPVTVWRGVTKDLSAEFSRGTLVTWWAFSSCTTELTVLENNMYLGTAGERTLFSVEVINGRTIRAHSHFVTEDEILLLPGTHMEVQSLFRPAPDLNIVHLRQIKPTVTLLELPFEGALLYPPLPKKTPWYKKKKTLAEIALIIIACIAGIIVGIIFATRKTPKPPPCYPRNTTIRADYFWSFDCADAREDLTGQYNGTLINGIQFTSPDFSGQGQACQLNRLLFQYISFPRSLNLTLNTSFTMSAWILLTGYRTKTLLTDCNSLNPICIVFIIDDIIMNINILNWNDGSILQQAVVSIQSTTCQGCWMYVSFTFNNQTGSTVFYLNGARLGTQSLNMTYPTVNKVNKTQLSYLGVNGISMTNYFYGLVDQLNILYSVKNDSEIQYEATTIFHYNFNNDNINADIGPNNIHGLSHNVYRLVSSNTSTLLFNLTDSYFQSIGFTLFDSNDFEYSIAFWLRIILITPDKINSATAVLQLLGAVSGLATASYSCAISMHVYPAGSIGFFFPKRFAVVDVNGSSIKNDTWTHIGIVYDSPETYYFYQDGILRDTDVSRRYSSIISSNTRFSTSFGGVYLNNSITPKPSNYEQMKCFSGLPVFNYTKMYGGIDDFIFLGRALKSSEIATLAASKTQTDDI
ncbi:unnamed protein product [Adineta steineri]|uniref:NAD(P)(+)--arginine ADP-ribosyltransferase n=1 Tax=Adineta steineri TaxID=433720 RepID=A0A819SI74_9BILA|nr:unnamed protein product [Adineta steineri]